MKRLGVDLDGCVADFVGSFFKISNRMFGTDYAVQTEWDFDDKYSKEQVDAVWEEIKRTRNFWQTLNPLPGTRGLGVSRPDTELVFITSRVPTLGHGVREQSSTWLRNHFYITYPFVIVVENPSEKIPLCKNLDISFFVDDKVSTVLQMHNAGIKSYVRLQPYNCQKPYPEGVVPVETVDEFLKLEAGIGA